MIVQRRVGGIRLINQHDHGLLAGVFAQAWSQTRPFEEVLLAGLHDFAWQGVDTSPLFDPESGLPHDFLTLPKGHRIAFYTQGIDALEEISPFVAQMTSRHYVSIMGDAAPESWRRSERQRQRRLHRPERGDMGGQLRWLQFFDTLSLFFCMTPPSALGRGDLPAWLKPEVFTSALEGRRPTLRWQDDATLLMSPFLFRGDALEVRLPCRDLSVSRFDGQTSMLDHLAEARPVVWEVVVRPGP